MADCSGRTEVAAPPVRALFTGFLWLGLTGFGGVMPLARRMLVERRAWLTGPEFTDLLGLCHLLPGGNIVNMSVAVGLRFGGLPGAVASLVGLVAAPTAAAIALGVLYDQFHADPRVAHLFAGLSAAAAGLLIATAVKMATPLRKRGDIIIAALIFAAIAIVRAPLLPTLLVLAPLSFAWARSRAA